MEKIYKDEKNKARIDLVDPEFIVGIAEILGYGAEKYEPYSFQKVTSGLDKYYAAAMRHLLAWRTGDFEDVETGQNHLLHAACNLMFLLRLQHMEIAGPLMSVEELNECNNNMGKSRTTEKCIDGSQANDNEGSAKRTSESENPEVPVVRWPPEYIRACSGVLPSDRSEPVVHGTDTDSQTGELHL